MRSSLSLLSVCAVFGCAGKAPPDPGKQPDAPPAATTQTVTGKVIDYFGNVPLGDVTVATDGIDPPQTTTTGPDGTFALDISIGSKLFLLAAKTNYRPTRNMPIEVAGQSVMQDAYIMSVQDVKNQYTVLAKTPTAGMAFLAADLEKNNGAPLEGIPLANVKLLDGNNQPAAGVIGPYFFGSAGSLDPALTTATAYGTPLRSRVAFLDVPPGTYTLSVTYPAGGGGDTTNTTTLSTAADGATMAISGGAGGAGGGSGAGATMPTFATDIYPRLQRAASGGLGCANCHTAGGPAAVLPYDDPPQTVLDHMNAITGVINLATPASSLFLVKPLYEQPPTPQDHPNATFLDVNDPDYKLFLLWIQQGAKP